jgi:hypothetical protein
MDQFDGPIPGENFTSDTKNYPWHRPPQHTELDDAIEDAYKTLLEKNASVSVITLLELGVSAAQIADMFCTSGIGKGKWTVDYASLKGLIVANNPGVEYLKFSAITRMPPENDPILEGVHTVGTLPEDYSGSHVNNEPDCFFSYLPFVRESGGLAMHVGNTNWNDLIKSLVKDFSTRRAPEFRLSKKAKLIEEVIVDENALSPDGYVLSEDGMRLILKINFDPKIYHSVSARYRSDE